MTRFGDLLRAERKSKKMTQDMAADFVGVERGAYGKVERGETIRPNNWEEYADRFGLSRDEVDAMINADAEDAGKESKITNTFGISTVPITRNVTPHWKAKLPAGRIPVLGMAAAGEPNRLVMLDEITGNIVAPPALAGVEGGYALYVHGTSMVPRYYPGELVYVHPHKPLVEDRFCVVQVGRDPSSPEGGYIKQFKSWDDGKLKLAQFNPPLEIEFDAENVVDVHRIVGASDD